MSPSHLPGTHTQTSRSSQCRDSHHPTYVCVGFVGSCSPRSLRVFLPGSTLVVLSSQVETALDSCPSRGNTGVYVSPSPGTDRFLRSSPLPGGDCSCLSLSLGGERFLFPPPRDRGRSSMSSVPGRGTTYISALPRWGLFLICPPPGGNTGMYLPPWGLNRGNVQKCCVRWVCRELQSSLSPPEGNSVEGTHLVGRAKPANLPWWV